MVRKTVWAGVFCALAGTALGCNSARHVVKEPAGGIVAIPCNSDAWPFHHRQHAEELMRAHCPNGYEIVREEEVVTGAVTAHDTRLDTHDFGDPKKPGPQWTQETVRQTSTTRQTTEWQIHYRAK